MVSYVELVRAVVKATVFLSSTEVYWFGTPAVQELPRRLNRVFPSGIVREYVLMSLQDHLYQNFYGKGGASPWSPHADHPLVSPSVPAFVKQLSDANSGVGYLEAGWEARRADGATVVVSRNGLEVRVRPEECVPSHGTTLSPSRRLGVRFPKESLGRLPGFYLAVGNGALAEDDWRSVVRVYWNVTAEGGVRLMRTATSMLNGAGVPFHLKVSADLGRFLRCDAAVLYLRKADYRTARGILERIHVGVSPYLRRGVPALTKPLVAGVGLAEDPGGGMSFGEHRCVLLADALIRAYELEKRSLEDRYEVVSDHFRQHGIGFETPYLNPGSDDIYSFRPAHTSYGRHLSTERRAHRACAAHELLATADRIAHQICMGAVWSEGRCNWTGAMVDAAANTNYGALDPSVYSGTSGVALFLAELHAVTGDSEVRATSLGAIRQALSRLDGIAPAARLGLFTGWTGIALAAARVGTLLREEELMLHARHLVHQTMAKCQGLRQFDVISGAAGAIVALLALQEFSPTSSLMEYCVRLGDELLEAADKTGGYWSWQAVNAPRDRNLMGFSHGTAGVGYALLELFHASGDVRYRRAAELAFQYERHWFDAEARNWPDLRGRRSARRRERHVFPSSTYWCHGAPGIALSRLRAYELTRDEVCKAEAITALETTRGVTEQAVHSGSMGFSLCHGLAGNAEVLETGERVLGEEAPGGSQVAAEVAAVGVERHGASGLWPSGTVGPTPSLMLGLAGIGHFYLRLVHPATPSILLVHPKNFARNGETALPSLATPRGNRTAMRS